MTGGAKGQDGKLNNEVYNQSACGLKYIHKATRVAARVDDWVYNTPIPTPVTISITEFPSTCFDVQKAYVWWVISDFYEQELNPKLTITTPDNKTYTVNAVQTGRDVNKGYFEDFTRGFRADVTPYITGNGQYKIDVSSEDNETDGITLMVIYKDYKASPMFEGHIVLQDGLHTVCQASTVLRETLNNVNACNNSTSAQAFMIISDLQYQYNIYNDYDTIETARINANGTWFTIPRKFWNSEVMNTTITKGQANCKFLIDETWHKWQECYSWQMMGLYYRTEPCQVCPEQLPVKAVKPDFLICHGDKIMLEATGGDSYEWTSIPPGFVSTQTKPVVAPQSDIKYVVKGIRGDNCIYGYDTIDVKLYPAILTNFDKIVEVCKNNSASIGGEASGGRAPFSYSWSPSVYLSADDVAMPVVTPLKDTSYILTITDANGCKKYDTVKVRIKNYKNVKINSTGKTEFCPCDSTLLTAEDGFNSYLWSTGDTTKSIWVRKTGKYTVEAVNGNGCKGLSDTVAITVYNSNAVVAIPASSAEPGKKVSLPLILKSAEHLDKCNYKDYYCVVSFDMTIMVPDGNYPYSEIINGRRFVGFTGKIGSSDTIGTLNCIATLGCTETSGLVVETFRWVDCPEETGTGDTTSFTLDSLCKKNNQTRLVYATAAYMKLAPNPARDDVKLDYRLSKSGYTKIRVMDLLGRDILTLKEDMMVKGDYSETYSLDALSNGQYMIIMTTPNDGTIMKMLEVNR